jgi:hypothetical protein
MKAASTPVTGGAWARSKSHVCMIIPAHFPTLFVKGAPAEAPVTHQAIVQIVEQGTDRRIEFGQHRIWVTGDEFDFEGPAAAKPVDSRPMRPRSRKSGSHWTRHWRKRDSNCRSRLGSEQSGLRRRSLSGESFGGEWLVRRCFPDTRGRGSFFPDLGEQPGLNRGGRPLSLRIVTGEMAGLEDYGAQLGDAAATSVVEVHKRKAGPGHRILQERDRGWRRQAMLAAQMQKSADEALAAVSVIITAARPVAVVGKKLEHEIEQLHRFDDFRFGHWFDHSRSG